MDEKRATQVSKFLSKYLRHLPERLGLTLGPGGWVPVAELLAACSRVDFPISSDELIEVVRTNSKQRFSFDETGLLIRANQGHSVGVDLQLEPCIPPNVLYHGTGESAVPSILERGILRMRRDHVHLSADVATAIMVGIRHGRPVVFAVDAAAMACDDYVFYRSDNLVWLVAHVPAAYLKRMQT